LRFVFFFSFLEFDDGLCEARLKNCCDGFYDEFFAGVLWRRFFFFGAGGKRWVQFLSFFLWLLESFDTLKERCQQSEEKVKWWWTEKCKMGELNKVWLEHVNFPFVSSLVCCCCSFIRDAYLASVSKKLRQPRPSTSLAWPGI
jgi:hypothetical protein